ncbi:MAG: hypothetical protein Kow0089_19900 [Desulfobulbaceae bacterium]
MKIYDPGKPLISIHIPKCAGQSFAEVLQAWFGKGYRRHYYDEIRNRPPVRHDLYRRGIFRRKFRKGICIHGHFNRERGIGVAEYYPEVDQFITILRDPFELHLSNYFFVKRLGKKACRSGKPHPIIENDMDVETYLRRANYSYITKFFPAGITLDNYREILSERFIFMGVAEKLQESVDLLADVLGFPAVQVTEKNVSTRKEDIPPDAREEFIRNNPLEMAIYDFALESLGLAPAVRE